MDSSKQLIVLQMQMGLHAADDGSYDLKDDEENKIEVKFSRAYKKVYMWYSVFPVDAQESETLENTIYKYDQWEQYSATRILLPLCCP